MLNRAIAFIFIAMLSPLLLAIAVVVRLTMGQPILFLQARGGQHGVPFELVKFRTMRAAISPGEPDRARVTRIGGVLRSTSLDELPSLWNIVRGDMVFVGPRPFHARYVNRYDDLQRRRLEVKPGLTGWAQVNGRNRRSWEEKFALDVWYVDNRSPWLDARIVVKTFLQLLRPGQTVHGGDETMPEFHGSAH